MCFVIFTSEDCHVEQSEMFMVQIRETEDLERRIMFRNESLIVSITDDDCKLFLMVKNYLFLMSSFQISVLV